MRWALMCLLAVVLCGDAQAAKKKKPPPPPPPPRAEVARTPPVDAHQAACPLTGLAAAQMFWTPSGYLWLEEETDVILAMDLGRPVAAVGTYGSCKDTTVELALVTGGTALNVEKVSIDVADIVRREVPWRTPEAKARRHAEMAIRAGNIPGAREALSGLNRADPLNVEAWVDVALAAKAEGDLRGAADDISGLPLQQEGVIEALVSVARAAVPAASSALDRGETANAEHLFSPAQTALDAGLSEGRWPLQAQRQARVVQGRLQTAKGDAKAAVETLRAVTAADPKMAEAWLALGEAAWAAKDKKGAREAYAMAAGAMARSTWPASLSERCPKCAKAAP